MSAKTGCSTAAGIMLGLGALVGLRCTSCVPAGHVRVVDVFGKVSQEELGSGINIGVNPLARRPAMDIRTRMVEEKLSVPTKEGMTPSIDISILYHLNPEEASGVYKQVGTNYEEVILIPTLRNVARDVITNYATEDLYGTRRKDIERDITTKLNEQYATRGVVLESVLMRDLELPGALTTAIELKMAQKQEVQKMEYVLLQETQKAEVRRVEASGLAKAQEIIAQTLGENYLHYKYVDGMKEAAKSPNPVTVLMPYDPTVVPKIQTEKPKE